MSLSTRTKPAAALQPLDRRSCNRRCDPCSKLGLARRPDHYPEDQQCRFAEHTIALLRSAGREAVRN
jgi:hypothetical protein